MNTPSDEHIGHLQAEGYFLSSDPTLLDLRAVQEFLTQSYWSPGITVGQVRLAADNSIPFGIYRAEESAAKPAQVAYGRVLTDYISIAYLLDLFVLPAHRGKGLASWLTQTILGHPEFAYVRSWMLATNDAHGLYEQHGFQLLEPGKHMRRPGSAGQPPGKALVS